jgi:hypothetical protein
MNNFQFDNETIGRWIAGFGAATPLAAQTMQQPSTPWWSLLLLPILAALGNVIAGVVMELLKAIVQWSRAKVRHEIKQLGENPDDPKITAPIAGEKQTADQIAGDSEAPRSDQS